MSGPVRLPVIVRVDAKETNTHDAEVLVVLDVKFPTKSTVTPLHVIRWALDATKFADIVTPSLAIRPPPAVPPVAMLVMVAHVTLTLIVIDVLPLQTSTSAGSREAHVSHEPAPAGSSFH